METFSAPKPLVPNPNFKSQKQSSLAGLKDHMIDAPIVAIIKRFNRLPFCYTLQSCFGHFVYAGQSDLHGIDPLPETPIPTPVEYRIAYIAFAIDNSDAGHRFQDALGEVVVIDQANIQFCSADWFWERQVNTYALQVEPDRFKHQDTAVLDYAEARQVEAVRNRFFDHIKQIAWESLSDGGSHGL
jgi:hypothetical protein